jgi:hypothetical protein
MNTSLATPQRRPRPHPAQRTHSWVRFLSLWLSQWLTVATVDCSDLVALTGPLQHTPFRAGIRKALQKHLPSA